MTLKNAILAALTDYRETGKLNKHNPAICWDDDGSYHYQSALQPHDKMVWDLQEGLGAWTPEPENNLESLAEFIANEFGEVDPDEEDNQ